jgi:hypothetical protein
MIAFGLQSDEEAQRAVEVLLEAGAPEVTALHTVTIYPTPAHLAGLERMTRLADLLDIRVGYSDHTVGRHVSLAAVALGAQAIEKHLTFDKADDRSLDNAGALEPAEWVEFVREIRELEAALGEQQRSGRKLGEILVAHGALTASQLTRVLVEQAGLRLEDSAPAAAPLDAPGTISIPSGTWLFTSSPSRVGEGPCSTIFSSRRPVERMISFARSTSVTPGSCTRI